MEIEQEMGQDQTISDFEYEQMLEDRQSLRKSMDNVSQRCHHCPICHAAYLIFGSVTCAPGPVVTGPRPT